MVDRKLALAASLNPYSASNENITKHNFRKWCSLGRGQRIDGQCLFHDLSVEAIMSFP